MNPAAPAIRRSTTRRFVKAYRGSHFKNSYRFIHLDRIIDQNYKKCIHVSRSWQSLRTVPTVNHSVSLESLEDTPALLRQPPEDDCDAYNAVATKFMQALRTGASRVVDIEFGTFDKALEGDFDRLQMPLSSYLDWLESTRNGRIDGNRQAYLAQHLELHEGIPALRELVQPPAMLQAALNEGSVDKYPTAMFIGPTDAVSPFHTDPYMNLFHVQASSDPVKYAKHVVLLPPSASRFMLANRRGGVTGNTSGVQLALRRRSNGDSAEFEVLADPDLPHETLEAIAEHAVGCVVREGETLFIPRGWWHRVQNVRLVDREGDDEPAGWTVAVAWWFLPRTRAPRS